MERLLLLKPLTPELQRPAVFGDDTHDVVRYTIRQTRIDLKRDAHVGAAQALEMRDDLLGDAAGVVPNTRRIPAVRCRGSA